MQINSVFRNVMSFKQQTAPPENQSQKGSPGNGNEDPPVALPAFHCGGSSGAQCPPPVVSPQEETDE